MISERIQPGVSAKAVHPVRAELLALREGEPDDRRLGQIVKR